MPFPAQFRPRRLRCLATLVLVKKCQPPSHRSNAPLRAGVALAFACACTAVAAQVDTRVRDDAAALVQQAAAAMAPVGARVVVTPGALDARLRLADCAHVEPYLVAGLPAWGHTRVGLRCTSGPVAWRAFLPVQVQVFAPAWTSRAALPAGALVATDQWQLAETDWAAAATPPLPPQAAITGRTLARPIAPGQALRETDLQARRWFVIGSAVRVVASGPGYAVQVEGQALGHGIEGQPVRVRTEGGRVVSGQPIGEALVEVRL